MFQGRSLDTIDEMHKSLLCFYTINTKTKLRQADATEKTPLDFWLIAFFPRLGYTGPEVRTMDMHAFGQFIAENRRARGLTQLQLAEALHVTDKAVSKWERGLSFPDVTLLEPLAAALGLTVAELMACRRQERAEQKGAEESMQNLLTISRDSVRKERRRSWQRLGAVLVLLAVTAAVAAWNALIQRDQCSTSIYLKETVNGVNYLYIDALDGHLLRLRCGDDIDFDSLQTGYDGYRMEYVWNQATHRGVVFTCTATGWPCYTGSIYTGSIDDSGYVNFIFGYTTLQFRGENHLQDPYLEPKGRVFVCDLQFFVDNLETGEEETVLFVRGCLNHTFADMDGDGELEIVIRTRWPEKPYTVYDMVNGEVVAVDWPDTVPEAVREQLKCIWEQ